MTTYAVQQRQPGQKLAGHFTILVDGYDAMYTCDPSQFLPKAMRQALEAGATPGEQATAAAALICDEYARRSLQRIVCDLQAGNRNPGGGILTRNTSGMGDFIARAVAGLTAGEKAALSAGDEDKAVHWFLNRGKLAGATEHRRCELLKHRDVLTDVELEQRKNQARLARLEERARAVESAIPCAKDDAQRTRLEARLAELLTEIVAAKRLVVAATHGFQYAYGQYLQGGVNLASDDIRIWPLMTNTTVDTERDAKDQFSDFTTVDEFDGANYASGGLALDNQAVNIDDANDRAEFDADDETVSSLGAGTRSIQGVCVGKFSVNTAGSLPLHWLEFSSNKTPDGSNFTFAFNAEGIIQAA
jgi:hypothetical protein